jgi:predicted  nucleic acid-binding Zn-ribbon protein
VEHSCTRCGANVEDGTAFCPKCSAPQIRVAAAEFPALSASGFATQSLPYAAPGAIQWSQALPSAALAGVIAAVLMFVPLGAFGIGMIAAGVLAVLFYRRRRLPEVLTPGAGARLGALSGMFGFGIFCFFTALEVLVFHSGGQLRAALLEAVQQSAARTSDPQAQQVLEYLKSPPGLTLVMAMGLAVMLVFFLLLSSASGAITAALLRRREK